jgi:hypothetical protein
MFSHLQTVKGDVLTRSLILLLQTPGVLTLYTGREGSEFMFIMVRISP